MHKRLLASLSREWCDGVFWGVLDVGGDQLIVLVQSSQRAWFYLRAFLANDVTVYFGECLMGEVVNEWC